MSKQYVNLTPHKITLNDGREFPPIGEIARIAQYHSPFDQDGISNVVFGAPAIYGDNGSISVFPPQSARTIYIVSLPVAQAMRRPDVVSPATNHAETRRDSAGLVISVPGFLRHC